MADPPTERTLTVRGHGRASQPADRAEVVLGVDLVRPTAGEARDAAADAMRAAIAAVERLGVARGDIRTSNLSLQPEVEYRPDGTSRRIGFRLANRVTIRVVDGTRVAEIVDAAIAAGATSLDGVSFTAGDDALARRSALAAAVADAASAASDVATAAGVALGAVRSVRESPSLGPVPRGRMALMEAQAADTPVLAGTSEVGAEVEVTWDLLPSDVDAG